MVDKESTACESRPLPALRLTNSSELNPQEMSCVLLTHVADRCGTGTRDAAADAQHMESRTWGRVGHLIRAHPYVSTHDSNTIDDTSQTTSDHSFTNHEPQSIRDMTRASQHSPISWVTLSQGLDQYSPLSFPTAPASSRGTALPPTRLPCHHVIRRHTPSMPNTTPNMRCVQIEPRKLVWLRAL